MANSYKKFFGHLRTINQHRRLVRKYCFKLGLYKQGLLHDLSKYSPTEFLTGCRYFQGTRSPNVAERLDIGYSTAWMHHKGRNKHHFEYWTDYTTETESKLMGVEMPMNYFAEMICDRIAASRIYKKQSYTCASPYEYYAHSHDRLMMHPKTEALLNDLLLMIRDKGEDEALSYIKHTLLRK